MDKPLVQLNRFFDLASERKLSGSDQLLYLHLFNAFNRNHWTETLRLSDKELMERLRLHDCTGKPASVETIRRAKQRLNSKGFIEFKAGKGSEPTEYKLIQLYPAGTPADAPDSTPVDTPADSGLVSHTHARQDIEDVKDVKTDLTPAAANARAYLSTNSDEVIKAWRECAGEHLTGGAALGLIDLENLYGTQAVVDAIYAADQANTRMKISFNFVKTVLENRLKGDEKLARTFNSNSRNEPAGIKKPRAYDDLVESDGPDGY